MSQEHSLNRRYFSKVSAGIVGMLANFIAGFLIPRALGPIQYGNFSFLTDYFYKAFGFLESGASAALFTKLAARPKETELLAFFIKLFGVMAIGILLFCFSSLQLGFGEVLWPEQEPRLVVLSFGVGALTWLVIVMNQVMDAFGLTTRTEVIRIFQRIGGLVILGALFALGKLSLTTVFLYNYVTLGLLIVSWWVIGQRHEPSLRLVWGFNRPLTRQYFSEFFLYCKPMATYTVASSGAAIAERWILQRYSGSAEQGFYGLSNQISTISFMFVAGMTPLLWREFSICFEQKNVSRIGTLLKTYLPNLGAVVTYFSVFLAFQAKHICLIAGGSAFAAAAPATAVMALYPIHQLPGQVVGSILLAAENTRAHRDFGIAAALVGVVVTYFLVAPAKAWGLNLGALGLAVKMLAVNIVFTHLKLWYCSRRYQLGIASILRTEVTSIFAFACFAGISTALFYNLAPLVAFLLSGILYTGLTLAGLYFFPQAFFVDGNSTRAAAVRQMRNSVGLLISQFSRNKLPRSTVDSQTPS